MESGRTGVMEGHPRASHSGGPPKSSRSPAPHRDASAEGPSSVQKPLGETAGAWTDHMRGPSRVQSLELEASIPKLVTHCPPDSPKPPSNLRPQYPSNSPQPIIETVSPNCPPDCCSVMRTNPGLYFVGAELPPRPQRPDSSTGFTAANEVRVSPTSDPNGTDGSEPEGDEAGDELRPGLRVHSDICPHSPPEEEYPELVIPLDEEEEQRRRRKKRPLVRRKRLQKEEEPVTCDVDQELDRALEDRAKQHNLTAVNVRNILHEVITNEHVVAMMKAAITETEGMPIFEPKMTRSKLKEVVEKGVVIPTWNLSPIKKSSKQQFVDIPLEEEDSSDEEYRPEEEDETAEESVHDSDVDSTASSPRGHKRLRIHQELQGEESMDGEQGLLGRHIRAESVPMGPPPPPKMRDIPDHAFMEKLHAVDEELECHPVTMDSFQSLDDSLIAFRTRSKRPLKNVPIGQLEAELRAPDITPDMYEPNIADDEDWKNWLCGLMRDDVGNEDEADDDDDPEYNILEDWDEPDTEDLRNDRAVRITKKEVNELMEELFETFQDEMGISHLEDEGADDEDSNVETLLDFNTPQTIRLEEPLLTEQHRTVRAQLEYLRLRKSLMTKTEEEKLPARESLSPPAPKLQPVMTLDAAQRKRLQQQLQQHIQLLTQLHLLTFRNPKLRTEADTAHMYLAELSTFADSSALTHSALTPGFQSEFWACNLKDALQLIPLVHSQVPEDTEPPKPLRKNVNNVPNLPKHTAWVLATRSVFMYPELLPVCAMKPRGPLDRVFFTKAEDNLLALGLKHFEGIEYSKQLTSKYLLTAKTAQQVTVRMKNLTMKKAPDNIIKFYKRSKMLPALNRCCEDILPQDARPPLEREKYRLPFWIKASLSSIEAEMRKSADSRYPLILPPAVSLTLKPLPRHFYQKSWRQRRSDLKPLLIRPNPVPKQAAKPPALQTVPITILGQVPPLVQPTVTMQGIVNLQPVSVPAGCRTQPGPCAAAAPTIVAQKARKPLIEAKTLAPTVTPILHSAPVVFAVPHGALKLVGVGTACGVLQLLSTESAVSVRTVLLNPNPVPLSQMPIQAPCTQTSQKTEDEEEWECVSITIKVEEGESSSATGAELPLEGRSQSDDVTEHVTPKIVEPDVTTEIPQSVPHQSLAASPGSKTEDPGEVEEPEEGNHAQNTEPAGDSPKNTSSSTTDGDVETNSPGGAQRDSSSPMDGQDLCNDKDVPEEEEDEDFDDLTQDEDDMSSEESVLSVPELQETMEKLTWLASERRLSQEGDSEDNSQEENTEPEEEEEEEGVDGSSHKPEEMTDEAGDEQLLSSHLRVPSPALVQTTMAPTAERRRGGSKGQSSHRGRNRRGRAPASKDASKLLLLYDEKILTKDPLREQKDMAYAQSYLTRVREALQSAPATYQQFLNLIYEFETKGEGKTAVDLYVSLRLLLHDWPQLLKDFAAFLLPEQALECGLFEEQQAFDKSRRFLRQLEICFQENPAQHQKIIRLLQSSAECPVQETGKLKTQMWQLLKGHTHLQEEFSLFFQQLRPPPSRMQDFEVMTWSEDKEYAFDGFEEVTIPDVEEEEDKAAAPPRSKRRKDTCHGPEKDADWLDGGKECPCSCHEVGAEQRMKRCKRRMCAPCAGKGCDSRSQRTTDVGATTVKDTGDSRLPLPKSTSSEARGPLDSSVSAQRLRAGADTGKARHQARGGSSRGGRKPHAVKSVVVQKAQQCSSPSEPNTPGLRSPPTTSSALCLNSAPEELSILQATAQEEEMTTVCAKNIKVSSSGEKVVVWTREADRVILTMCQEQGAHNNTFRAIAVQLDHKSPSEVAQRFRELINLFQTGCVTSSDDEEEEE